MRGGELARVIVQLRPFFTHFHCLSERIKTCPTMTTFSILVFPHFEMRVSEFAEQVLTKGMASFIEFRRHDFYQHQKCTLTLQQSRASI